ncbi:MAG: BON domain-containing protein [Aureliella sp.]
MSLVTGRMITVQPVLNAISHLRDQSNGNAGHGETHSLRHQVARALCDSPYSELKRAKCETHDDTIVLRGQVSSYYLKQMAQSLVARVAPAARIRNQLQVVYLDCKRPRKPR